MQTKTLGRWYVGFGLFLVLCGVLGYLSNPEKAKTALLSGGTFGTLSAVWGIWMLRGGQETRLDRSSGTTLLLVAAFTWRSTASWQAFLAGEPKLIAAVLITAMWIASVASLFALWKARVASFSLQTTRPRNALL